MIAFVRHWRIHSRGLTSSVRRTVAALAYLRNPYDRIFDLHVEGGFADDITVSTARGRSYRPSKNGALGKHLRFKVTFSQTPSAARNGDNACAHVILVSHSPSGHDRVFL